MAKNQEGVPDYEEAGQIQASEGGEGWHPELPRVKFEGLLGKDLVFLEIEKRQSTYDEAKQYGLIRCVCPGKALSGELDDESVVVDKGAEFTTSTGRVRVVEQIDKATLPTKGTVSKGSKSSGGFDIWELVPWS